jgi:hypothetical protein
LKQLIDNAIQWIIKPNTCDYFIECGHIVASIFSPTDNNPVNPPLGKIPA